MKLTKADREYIRRNFWEDDKHIDQIEDAISKTKFQLGDEPIGVTRAVAVLGREKFLAGMDRSAFHWSAVVQADNGQNVYFDSSAYFKED